MRKLLLLPFLLGACSELPTNPARSDDSGRVWAFMMPSVHTFAPESDTIPAQAEYLFCQDTLSKGVSCEFRGISGTYEEAGDWSFLNTPDSSIKWPNHDGKGPLYIGRVSLPIR